MNSVRMATSIAILLFANTASPSPRENGCLRASIAHERTAPKNNGLERQQQQLAAAADNIDALVRRIAAATPSLPPIVVELRPRSGAVLARPGCGAVHHGTLVFGMEAYSRLKPLGDESLEFIVAHEIGHFLQYQSDTALRDAVCNHEKLNVRSLELMADFLAGFLVWSQDDEENPGRMNLMLTISSLSDYEFTNVSHHGTVTERNSAFGMGQYARFADKSLDMRALMRKVDFFDEFIFAGTPKGTYAEQDRAFREVLEDLFR